MEKDLDKLIEEARNYQMSDAEREEQVRSFAYGNIKLHNPNITRADIDKAADLLKEEHSAPNQSKR